MIIEVIKCTDGYAITVSDEKKETLRYCCKRNPEKQFMRFLTQHFEFIGYER
jgi:hypothetical protein